MKKTIAILALILAIAGLAAYFFLRSTDTCRSVIPEDAKAVAMLRPAELVTGLGLTVSDIVRLASSDKDEDLFLDPTKSMYSFVTRDGYTAFTAAISSTSSMSRFCESHGMTQEEQRGLHWAMSDNVILCYDKHKVLAYTPVSRSEQINLREQMTELMNQSAKKVPVMRRLEKSNSALAFTTSLDLISAEYVSKVSAGLPEDVDLSEIFADVALSVEERGIALTLEMYSENPSLEKHLSALNELTSPIKGSLVDIGPSSPALWMCVNLQGDRLLELLRKQPDIRTTLLALNMVVDADMMIRAIKGDVSIAIPYLYKSGEQFLLTAELSNTDFLRNVDDWKHGMVNDAGVLFEELGQDRFRITYDGNSSYFGVVDGRLYITNKRDLAAEAGQQIPCEARQALLPQMKRNTFFATFAVGDLLSNISLFLAILHTDRQTLDALAQLDRLNVEMDENRRITLRLTTKDKLKDILSSIVEKK